MKRFLSGVALVLAVISLSPKAEAAFAFDSVGVRHAKAVNKFSGAKQQAVIFTFRRTERPPKFFYPASLDFTIGRFSRDADDSIFISFGPSFRPEIGWFKESPWYFEYGLQPTLLKGSQLGDKNMGGDVQFTTHLGLGRYFGRQHQGNVFFRIQHTSNGRLNSENPGVDMFGLEIHYAIGKVRRRWKD